MNGDSERTPAQSKDSLFSAMDLYLQTHHLIQQWVSKSRILKSSAGSGTLKRKLSGQMAGVIQTQQ